MLNIEKVGHFLIDLTKTMFDYRKKVVHIKNLF